ncbi:MAG: hypothetical protein NVS4B2_29260 [Chloroflexota bacterium]
MQDPGYCSSPDSGYLSAVMLCAVNDPTFDTGTCSGDSGGPLAADVNGRPVQIGITSGGPVGCGTRTTDYFTTVRLLAPWANAWTRAVAPSPPPPRPPQPALPLPPFMTSSAGRSHVMQTVVGVFGNAFERRHYATNCSRQSPSRISCKVVFQAGPSDYYGNITVYSATDFTGTGYWGDNYTMHWVNHQCIHSTHRSPCRTHTKQGSW